MFRTRRKRPSPPHTPRLCRWCEGDEPSVDELLADPLVQLVMQRDRIGPDDVQAVLASVRPHIWGMTAPA